MEGIDNSWNGKAEVVDLGNNKLVFTCKSSAINYLCLELLQVRECCGALRFVPASASLACSIRSTHRFKKIFAMLNDAGEEYTAR